MELYIRKNSDHIILEMKMVEFHFLLKACCYTVTDIFNKESIDYPPKDYTFINSMLKFVNIIYNFQQDYINNPTYFYLVDKELKKNICDALSIFAAWKNMHRKKEVEEHEGNENWGSGLSYTNWNPEDLNKKFMDTGGLNGK